MNTLLIFLGIFIFTVAVIIVIGRIQKKREARESIRPAIDSDDRDLDDLKPGEIVDLGDGFVIQDGKIKGEIKLSTNLGGTSSKIEIPVEKFMRNMELKEQKESDLDLRERETGIETGSVGDIQERINRIKEQVAQVKRTNQLIKWEMDKNKVLPEAKDKTIELRKLNSEMSYIQTPEKLDQCKAKLISLLEWFVKIENDYPGVRIMENPKELIQYTRNTYNDNLLRITIERFKDYSVKMNHLMSDKARRDYTKQMLLHVDTIRQFVDIESEYHIQVFDRLKEIHYDIEEIYG